MTINKIIGLLCLLPVVLLCGSCAPTYPKDKIIEGVKSLCEKEYDVKVEVKIEGSTLGIRLPLEGLFDPDTLQIKPEAFDKITGVMLSASRVALSSDKSIDFYTVITYDKKVPGAEVVMTRYIFDLRRFFLGDISRGEFAKRMVFDVRFNPQAIIDNWLGDFTLKEQTLPQFACAQISRRITEEFSENKELAGKFKIAFCDGIVEEDKLEFVVDISREGLPLSELIHGNTWHEQVLEFCMKKICYVVYIYNLRDIDTIEIFNKFDNKTLTAPREDIDKWRKRRIRID